MVRRLPIRVKPMPGEALSSWLDRYCERLRVSRGDFYKAAGLVVGPKAATDFAICLQGEQAANLSIATGIPVEQLHAMTLARYEGRCLFLTQERNGVDIQRLWARWNGWRYCPECLAEHPGTWKLSWRLTWVYACTRHSSLLRDTCPDCGKVRGINAFRWIDVPKSNICRLHLVGQDRGVDCEYELSRATPMSLPVDSPLLAAQKWIEDLIDDGDIPVHGVRHILGDLKLLAGRALAVLPVKRLREVCGTLAMPEMTWNLSSRGRIGQFPVMSAIAIGHGITWAASVLRSELETEFIPPIRQLVEAERQRGVRHCPTTITSYWGTPSTALELKLLAGVHPDLKRLDSLRYLAASGKARHAGLGQAEILERSRSVPQQFWPAWVNALNMDESLEAECLQKALSIATLLPGYKFRDLSLPQKLLLSDANVSHVFGKMSEQALHRSFSLLTALSEYLDDCPAPIDYRRRRELTFRNLLPTDVWRQIHHSLYGGRPRPPDAARVFVYYRITGSLPPKKANIGPSPYYVLQNFLCTTPVEELQHLEEYAESLLRHHHIIEPLTWEPPLELLHENGLGIQEDFTTSIPGPVQLAKYGLTDSTRIRRLIHEKPTRGFARSRDDRWEHILRESIAANLSVAEIALQFGMRPATVRRRLNRFGQSIQTGKRPLLTEEWLHTKYVEERRTIREIAEATGWSASTVREHLVKFNVPRRPAGGDSGPTGVPAEQYSKLPPLLKAVLRGRGSLLRLQRFLVTASCPTFRTASRALQISISSLVIQIQGLESYIQGTLVIRATKTQPMKLTPLGRTLVRLAVKHDLAVHPASRSLSHKEAGKSDGG